MTTGLHPITGKNRFCGPSAMTTVLGVTTDHAARVIRGLTGERRVKGVPVKHFIAAMEQLGGPRSIHPPRCALCVVSRLAQGPSPVIPGIAPGLALRGPTIHTSWNDQRWHVPVQPHQGASPFRCHPLQTDRWQGETVEELCANLTEVLEKMLVLGSSIEGPLADSTHS